MILTDPTEDVVETPVNGIKFSTVVVSEPTAEVAPAPAGVKLAPAKIIKLLREVETDCPDKVNETSVCGANAPTADVVDKPVSICVSLILTAPIEDVVKSPVGVNETSDLATGEPNAEVVESPVNEIISSTEGESEPTEDVVDKPVNDTSIEDSPQFSKPHVSEPQPVTIKSSSPHSAWPQVNRPHPDMGYSYAILSIAFDASAAGNSIVKVPLVTVLSPPNAIAQTDGSPDAVSLKIKQPLAVNEADVKDTFAKSHTAVSPDKAGVTFVSATPLVV